CLRQCLLIGHRLRRLGPVLRIGVKRDANGVFCAHSWLEVEGSTLDPTAAEFAVLGSAGR
ncbi:MAG: lasso peptide biosynthesis protein, partial [Pseudonocardiaceae bacterium]